MSVTLPSLIASGMVLQRDAAVTLWTFGGLAPGCI